MLTKMRSKTVALRDPRDPEDPAAEPIKDVRARIEDLTVTFQRHGQPLRALRGGPLPTRPARGKAIIGRIVSLPVPPLRAPPLPQMLSLLQLLRAGAIGAGALFVLAATCCGPTAAQTAEGGLVRTQHGDWQVVCKPPSFGAKNEVCRAVQNVQAEDNNTVELEAIVQKLSDGKTILRVIAPLGVFLGKALGVQIDNQDQGHVPFDRCLPMGCQARFESIGAARNGEQHRGTGI